MHSLIPTSEGFLGAEGTVIARWNGTTATSLGSNAAYANPIQHAYHSDKVLLVNGSMTPSEFSGGSLTALSFTSGITSETELIGVTVFKGRAIYWKSEAGFYYANAGSFQGDLAYFNLAPFSDGTVVFCFTYSTDAGDGTDDMFVIMMSTGQALVYQGNDPGDSESWELISKYTMAPPLGIRGRCDFQGDQIILTERGWINFDHVVKNGNMPGGIGHKIVDLARTAVSRGTTTNLWEAHYIASKGLVVITTLQDGSYIYHVMNVLTGAWCTFTGFDTLVWAVKDGQGYYETDQKIFKYSGYDSNVTTDAIPAYTQLGSDGYRRQVTAIRPVTTVDSDTIGISAAGDFNTPEEPGCSLDASQRDVNGEWRSLNEFAYNISYRMKTCTANYEKRWYSTSVMFKQGGAV